MSPDEMKGLNEKLNSMFKWGLVAEIKSAEYETRMAILETNAELLGMNIDDDLKEVLSMIAENIKMDTRELKATLKRLINSGYSRFPVYKKNTNNRKEKSIHK